MKKKFLFTALLAAMLFAGCASNDEAPQNKVDTPAEAGNTAVGFNAYTQRGVTRSGLIGGLTTSQLELSKENKGGFGVFAYYTDLKKYDQTYIPNFMYNQGVFKSGTKWAYTPVLYWPNEYGSFAGSDDEDKVTFFAYAPFVESASVAAGSVEDATYGITGFSRNTSAGDPLVKYIASFDPQKTVDLCWGVCSATSWNTIQGGGAQAMTAGLPWLNMEHPRDANQAMTFNFKHALAQLNVQIDADIDVTSHNEENALDAKTKIYVRSISFTGIAQKGALNLNNTEPDKALWLDYSGTTDLPYGESVTVKDGRRDGREGASGAEATNETPVGLNPQVIQSSGATTGVTHLPQNLFKPQSDDPDDALVEPVYVIPTGEAMTVTIVYDVEAEDDDLPDYLSNGTTHGSSIENKITKTISFGDDGQGLKNGMKYTLQLHLGMNSVKFNAGVTAWDDTNYGGNGWLPGNTTSRLDIAAAPAFGSDTPAPSRRFRTRGVSVAGEEVTLSYNAGEAMGLYVMDGEGAKLKNIKVEYNGAGWSTEAPVTVDASYSYYLYYPYNAAIDESKLKAKGGYTADEFFADYIQAFTPQTDQSTLENLMKSMLMVAKGTINGTTISFTPEHKMSLIQLTDHKYKLNTDEKYTWEYLETEVTQANKPYINGTTMYYLAKPGSAELTFGTKGMTPGAVGKYNAATITETTHTLAVGDIMCDDGSLWANDNPLGENAYTKIVNHNTTYGTSLKPIGIVFKADGTSVKDQALGFKNGYVMSLYAANSGVFMSWASGNGGVVTDVSYDVPNALTPAATVDEQLEYWNKITVDYDGLTHCNYATSNNTTFVKNGQYLLGMEAAYKNNLIGSKTPSRTSNWYLPSIGQLFRFIINIAAEADPSVAVATDISRYRYRDKSTTPGVTWSWHDFWANGLEVNANPSPKIIQAINSVFIAKGLTPNYVGSETEWLNGRVPITYEHGHFQAFSNNSSDQNNVAVGPLGIGGFMFWSSTERHGSCAFCWIFNHGNNPGSWGIVGDGDSTVSHAGAKESRVAYVRPVLAF